MIIPPRKKALNREGILLLQRQRPFWWREEADIALDHRSPETERPPLIPLVLAEASRLEPGQTLSVTLGFEPTLLYRLLEDRGYERWSETVDGDDVRIDVYAPRRSPGSPKSRGHGTRKLASGSSQAGLRPPFLPEI